jgi:PBP1b-binding outer membrane lipoprotein LpoB
MEVNNVYNKKIMRFASIILCAIILASCGQNSQSQVPQSDASIPAETTASGGMSDVLNTEIKIEIGGEVLPFPFEYEKLEKLIDLSDVQNVYLEKSGISVCTVYSNMTRICTLFVQGDISKNKSGTLVTRIAIDNPENDIIRVNGLKDDTKDAFILEFGEAKSTDNLLEYTWDNLILSVMFDSDSGKASNITLLDTNYPYY